MIGLAGHEQIQGLYEEVGLNDQLVIAKKGFSDCLIHICDCMFSDPKFYSERQRNIMNSIYKSHQDYAKEARSFLGLNAI